MPPRTRQTTSPVGPAASDDDAAALTPEERLQRENAALRAALSNAGIAAPVLDAAGRAVPQPPSFGMSEGVRQDLIQHGVTTDPNTGARIVAGIGAGAGVEPGNAAARAAAARYAKPAAETPAPDQE